MQSQQTSAVECEGYLFDGFEASLKLGTLLQKGERLRVQYLPFRMLIALLERPGELVTKEELARQLWGQQVLGDTDKSLYVMAGKLRQALGDNATEPRFIQTVSGRGYTFIGSVTLVSAAAQEARIPLSAPSPPAGLAADLPSVRASPMSRIVGLPVRVVAMNADGFASVLAAGEQGDAQKPTAVTEDLQARCSHVIPEHFRTSRSEVYRRRLRSFCK